VLGRMLGVLVGHRKATERFARLVASCVWKSRSRVDGISRIGTTSVMGLMGINQAAPEGMTLEACFLAFDLRRCFGSSSDLPYT
jgi:hypothetical protein